MTGARTRWLGVLGWPIAHSRSPAIHSAALAALGIDAVYVPLEVAPAALAPAIAGLRALGALGANVTVPHKERVIALLDRVDPDALAIGAVNTIVREGEALVGANTDVPGLVRSLEHQRIAVRGRPAMVIGAGGAARAALAALASMGATHVDVVARRPDIARRLAAPHVAIVDLADAALVRRASERAHVIVQATSAALGDGEGALAARLPFDAAPKDAVVVDLVYGETEVIRAARARGLRAVDGLGMLVFQAAVAFERWFGVAPPIEVMFEAARAEHAS